MDYVCDRCGRPLDPAIDMVISDDAEFLHAACAKALGCDTRTLEDDDPKTCELCGLEILDDDDWSWARKEGRERAHASCLETREDPAT